MSEVELSGLSGRNPLGFLAALGTLDVLDRAGLTPTLRWTADLVPRPVVTGVQDVATIIAAAMADVERWQRSPVLNWPPGGPVKDLKMSPATLEEWAREIARADPADIALWSALVAQGGYDRNGRSKPTHLHFTAGQQQFLAMARALALGVDAGATEEALVGPWRYESSLPSFSWDSRGERIYALRGGSPTKETRQGVPGADWLGFLGLRFYPVSATGGRLYTTAADPDWMNGTFRWPVWAIPVRPATLFSLLADPTIVGRGVKPDGEQLRDRGIGAVLAAPIRRSAQGYGTFGAPTVVAQA